MWPWEKQTSTRFPIDLETGNLAGPLQKRFIACPKVPSMKRDKSKFDFN